MSKVSPTLRVPSYRRHKPSGQVVVSIGGKDFYLGPYRSRRSKDEYDRLIHEWLAGGRNLPRSEASVSVVELVLAYWNHAQEYYHRPDSNTGEVYAVKSAGRLLRTTYGELPAADFGPRKLKALRLKMIAQGLSRPYVNATTSRIKRLFKWGVAEELVPGAVLQYSKRFSPPKHRTSTGPMPSKRSLGRTKCGHRGDKPVPVRRNVRIVAGSTERSGKRRNGCTGRPDHRPDRSRPRSGEGKDWPQETHRRECQPKRDRLGQGTAAIGALAYATATRISVSCRLGTR